jgi:DUF2934 family protein
MTGVEVSAISARAYSIWEQEGRPEGRALNHWVQAEAELKGAIGVAEVPTLEPAVEAAMLKTVAAQMAQPAKQKAT